MVALKRLADAERDGDRIYGVIKATAGSSDGRALGLTAPRSEGQVRALHRAYDKAGFPAASLSLVEAHGTGTPVGDRTETQTIARALNDGGARPSSVSVGSVKTLLGHTKAAAGVAGLIKVTLALYHRVLPGHHGVSKPIETVADANSPVYLLKDARPWIAHPDHPRRGAASAFGFGGTNFHAVVEEYRKPASVPGASGSNRWPYELFLFRAKDDNALAQDLEKLVPHLQAASRIQTSALAAMLARAAEMNRGLPVCLAIVAGDRKGLAADLAATIAHLRGGNRPLPAHVRLNRNTPETSPQVAFLFPGQGAQYVNMGREAAIYLSEVREALEFADGVLRNEFPDQLSSLMYPPAAFDTPSEKAQLAALTDTRIAQPAIGSMSLGYLRFTERLGISAQATAGHSYGEYTALMAAGVIDAADFLRLSAVRGRAMADASKSTVPGAMAAVHGRRERVNALARALPGLRVANHNAPEQTVISGPREAVEAAARTLTEEGLRTTLLPVSGAFHTELVAPAKAPLSKAIHATRFRAPRAAVYSNTTASLYPNDPAAMQRQLDDHMLSGVEFVTEIETMYAAGARVFLELGPKGTCANLTRQTLSGRNATAISLDAGGGGLRGLLIGVSELLAAGVQLDVMALFADRQIPRITASELPVLGQPPEYPAHMWMVSGGCARPVNDPVLRTGAKPALTRATAEAARKAFDARLRAKPPAPSPTVDPLPAKGEPPQAPTMPAAASSAMGQDALIAYQQTMRQFLSLQERVIQQYMQGDRSAPAPAVPNVAAMPAVDSSPQVVTPAQAMTAPTAAVPVPKPATPTPARPASTASAVDAKQLLLDIVAERTGYPAQMLELDAPLEADLGIDSIKRVEILGALRNAMPDTVAEQMQAQMEQLTRAETLNAILALLPAPAQTSTPAPAQVSAEPPAASEAVAVAVDWKAELLKIVADRTGYPEEMLSVDADLEADLGIDSIKRVEIVGALRESVPEAAANKIADITENLTRASTLAAMIQQLPDIAQASPAATIPSPQAAPAPAAQPKPATRLPLDVLLRDIVAERTGYPQEMLATDADLEADLGIDSIKRVEILGALRQ
ncbi:MAG: acyltransferase domain-containing protein, partial [Panacagrimonas sp.]